MARGLQKNMKTLIGSKEMVTPVRLATRQAVVLALSQAGLPVVA